MDSDGRGRRFSEGKEKSMSMSPTNDGLDSSADQNGLTKRSPSPTSPPVKVAPRSITKVESRLLDLAKEKPSYRRRRDSSSDKETDRRKRKSKSPDERRKRSRTPPSRRSRSPRKSRSPRRRSRTPKRRNSSPDRNRSPPRRRSRSRSVTPPRRKRSRSPRKSRRSPSRTPPRRSRRSRSRSNERRRRSRSRSSDRRRRSRSRSRGKGRSRSRSRDRRSRRHSRSPSPMFTSKWGQRPTGICRAVLPANGDEKRTRQVTTEDVEKRLAQHMQTVQQKAAEDAKKINLPGYLNPAMVNVHQFKQVQDKRKLLWSKAKDKKDTASAQWSGAFDKDKDQSNDEKFRRLMGIGETAVEGGDSEKVQQSRKVLDDLEKEYEKSRAFQLSRGAGGLTGIGLGFGSAMQPQ